MEIGSVGPSPKPSSAAAAPVRNPRQATAACPPAARSPAQTLLQALGNERIHSLLQRLDRAQ